uniref:Peptidase S1 domain-containing protein n=1 Tax=Panagrolaimus superbus TaxID=310955 RepID=A0A914YZ59_9BILA
MICIGGVASGVAHGDSGGPIMAIRNNKWYVLGELYAGFFESIPSDDLAQVTHAWYTKIKPYCDWLAEVTHGEVVCE